MKPGQGNGNLIADLHTGISDEEMRRRWKAGIYDIAPGQKPKAEYVIEWRRLAGRK